MRATPEDERRDDAIASGEINLPADNIESDEEWEERVLGDEDAKLDEISTKVDELHKGVIKELRKPIPDILSVEIASVGGKELRKDIPLDLYGGQMVEVNDAADELGISQEAYAAKRLKELETGEVADDSVPPLYTDEKTRAEYIAKKRAKKSKVEVLHAVKVDEWPMLMERDLEAKLAKTKTKVELTKSDISGLEKLLVKIEVTQLMLFEYTMRIEHRLELPKKGGFKLQTVSSRDVNE